MRYGKVCYLFIAILLLLPGLLRAQGSIGVQTGPVPSTVGLELEARLTPRTALLLSPSYTLWKSGGHRGHVLLAGVRLYLKPPAYRWMLTGYGGLMQVKRIRYPLAGLTGGYLWNLSSHLTFSLELGIGVTTGILLIAPVPLPFPMYTIRIGYQIGKVIPKHKPTDARASVGR